jgi:hypothetical protein
VRVAGVFLAGLSIYQGLLGRVPLIGVARKTTGYLTGAAATVFSTAVDRPNPGAKLPHRDPKTGAQVRQARFWLHSSADTLHPARNRLLSGHRLDMRIARRLRNSIPTVSD